MVKLAFTEPTIPEHPQLTFISSGPMGGDAGHGADAVLKITFPNTGAIVELSNPEARFEDHDTQGEEISISVCGDWEIDGFEEGLITLGRQLSGESPYVRISLSRDQRLMLEALANEAEMPEEEFAAKLLVDQLHREAHRASAQEDK